MIEYTPKQFEADIWALVYKLTTAQHTSIYGVPRGGVNVAIALSQMLKLPMVDYPVSGTLVVDDLIDGGGTRERYKKYDFACLHIKKNSPIKKTIYYVHKVDDWVEYWWEKNEAPAEDAVVRLIQKIGEDPNREGLLDTPKRVIKSYDYLFSGYKQNPEDIMTVFTNEGCDQIVLLKDIEFYSMCEHHNLPFFGKAHIAYLPNKKIIGVSKLARLLDIYSRRMQIQERIVEQVTSTIMRHLEPLGAACIIEAQHLCMKMRGVEKQNSAMVTSSMKGVFLNDPMAKNELMLLIK